MATKTLSTPADFEAKKSKEKDGRLLLTPADFDKFYLRVSKWAEKDEVIPKEIEHCVKCENVQTIKRNTKLQTSCYCYDILPPNYLTQEKSGDDVYTEMLVESDLPW